jgi:hypothetical protein
LSCLTFVDLLGRGGGRWPGWDSGCGWGAGRSDAQFHPDGLILGTGTADSLVRVWDIKSQHNVVTFPAHQARPPTPTRGCLVSNHTGVFQTSSGRGDTVNMLNQI